jgi:hypothetical protein
MSGQQFVDSGKQLIVRLDSELLAYIPAGEPGWKCRLTDIGWTSSEITPHGIGEVRLHARDGRVVARIPDFEQVERFYIALLHRLAERPVFDAVRADLPTQVPRLERVMWLAGITADGEGEWKKLHVDSAAAAVATVSGLILAPAPDAEPRRIAWKALAGVRCRYESLVQVEPATRFFTADGYVELPLSCPPESFLELCYELSRAAGSTGTEYHIRGVSCADSGLAMTFSWELERAAADALLRPDEKVVACAYGTPDVPLVSVSVPEVEAVVPKPLEAVAAVLGAETAAPPAVKTELILTERRLLRVDRTMVTGGVLEHVEFPLARLPVVRNDGSILTIGPLDVDTDATQPFDMAGRFFESCRRLVGERLDPFSPQPDKTLLVEKGAASDAETRVRELAKLHQLGFISDDEFASQKAATEGLEGA